MPAFFSGLFGHKPSPGLVSCGGQFPQVRGHQLGFLSAGPLCRYAEDLAPALTALAGPRNVARIRLREPVDIRSINVHYLDEIDRCFTLSAVHPDVKAAVNSVVSHLRDRAGVRATPVRLPSLRLAFEMWAAMMCSGDSPCFGELLRECGSPLSPGLELLRWIGGCSEHTFNTIALALAEAMGLSAKKDSRAARSLCARSEQLRRDLECLLGAAGVLLLPTHPEPAPYHGVPTLRAFNFAYAGVFNVLGLPATACPVGLGCRSGLPVGVQLVAAKDNDRLCLALAAEIERAFGGWRDPAAAGRPVVLHV
ncbi:hypothetical protein HPB48_015736 [Haemaphysalis longicornis]|uniref:Amidase domain-containing protein n=1 Tax=Haemaphysalis longicornis TaxID=44386 RepID=A0A9J6H6G1_HAELO|nr:hypothetical protein HPB48_015736 [Haemaphysalis longicornis]